MRDRTGARDFREMGAVFCNGRRAVIMALAAALIVTLADSALFSRTQAAPAARSANIAEVPGKDPFHGDKAMQETWRKSQILRQELSTDTAPESLTIGKITYLVPRNYIYNRYLLILEVTYPNFEPFTDKTRYCFDRQVAYQGGCRTLELRLGAPYTGKSSYYNFYGGINAYRAERRLDLIHPHQGPYGYDVFGVGPDDARTEYYANGDLGIYFRCLTRIVDGEKVGTCTDGIALADSHLSVGFSFSLKDIGDVSQIESGIRKLMSLFPYKDNSK